MPRPASSPMASSARSCGGLNAPSVASDTRCTTCAASAGPSSSIAAVTNAARLRKWRPPAPPGPCPCPGPPNPPGPQPFPPQPPPKPGPQPPPKPGPPKPPKPGPPKPGPPKPQKNPPPDIAVVPFQIPNRTIKLLDTTVGDYVKKIDGCLRGTTSRMPACGHESIPRGAAGVFAVPRGGRAAPPGRRGAQAATAGPAGIRVPADPVEASRAHQRGARARDQRLRAGDEPGAARFGGTRRTEPSGDDPGGPRDAGPAHTSGQGSAQACGRRRSGSRATDPDPADRRRAKPPQGAALCGGNPGRGNLQKSVTPRATSG